METILRALVDRRIVVIISLILLLYVGKAAYVSIPKESNPDIKLPIFQISVYYRGVSPEDSERLLARPLENALRSISGVKEITSYAFESNASIILEFYAGTDNKKALDDVRSKVTEVEKNLPAEADKPIIIETDFSLMPVVNVALTGDIPIQSLVRLGRELRDKIESLPEVRQVTIGGDLEDVIEIIVDPKTLEIYKLSLSALRQLIDGNNKLVAAGTLKSPTGEFSIKLPSVIKDVTELLNFPVKVENDAIVRLQDVASVKRTFKEPETIARVNGKPAVVLEVAKRSGENIIHTVAKVKELVAKESIYWPSGLKIIYSQDESDNIMEMVADLENTLILAMLLVIAVIILSVGKRAALLISFSLPTSFLAGILILYMGGFTLNVVVLFSLILSVGMIVDDAIVISEYADRKVHAGMDIQESFINAAVRMLWPIITSTLVKLIVFMPLLFWPGVVGQFMKFMPITVIIVLTNSLLYALFIQPVIGPYLGKDKNSHQVAEIEDINHLTGGHLFYYKLLIWVMQRPGRFAGGVFASLILVYIVFFNFGVGVEFFPKIEPERATVAVVSPGNMSIKQKDIIMHQMESLIADMTTDIAMFYTKSGNFIGQQGIPKDTIGIIQLELMDWQKRRKAKYIMDEIRERLQKIKGVDIQIIEARDGPPSQKPIAFDLTARNFAKAEAMAAKIVTTMQNIGGFKDVETSMDSPAIEWQLAVDRALAARHLLDIGTIGDAVQLVTNGLVVSKYRPDDVDDEVDVILRFPPHARSISTLEQLKVTNINGETVPISNFVEKKSQLRVGKIRKVDRNRVVSIMANVEAGLLVDNQLNKLKEWMSQPNNWDPDVEILFRGEDRDQNEAQSFLSNAFLLALVMMFMVMLIQFNNLYHAFIIMTAVFLSTVGVLLGLLITAQPFGIVMCGVGVIALGGIVLNNNILFVDTYQYLRNRGETVEQAIIGAGVQRLRPILLTAITAVLGLMPMVLGLTINFYDREITYDAPSSQWWRQLSASIAGGLTFATLLTLFFTPALLLLGRRFDKAD
jgi:multidrug efflux pump